MTVRDMVREIQRDVRNTSDLLPGRACELLNRLTSLYGNVLDECRASDLEYKRVLLESLHRNEAANRAKIEAETTPQYVRRQEAEHTRLLTLEMIRSLKVFLKSQAEEMRLSR